MDRLEPAIWDCWDENAFNPDRCAAPDEFKLLWAAQFAESDINNGGMHQFFGNPCGRLAPEAAAGFRLLGINGCAEAIEAAMTFFGSPFPRDDVRRGSILDEVPGRWTSPREVWDPFVRFDDAFYTCLDSQDDWFDRAATELTTKFA
jgi:hypothetical protein